MSDKSVTTIVLVGIGGYASGYVNALLTQPADCNWKLVGVVDPLAEKAPKYNDLKALGLPFFKTLDEFYAELQADLAVISSPIQFHCEQSCTAMRHGTNVLCEKPSSAVVQETVEMAKVSAETGKFCAIGYQWSYSPQMLALKKDILAGKYGKAKQLRSLTLWPRNDSYYGRNNWAGALKSASGAWILDSPVNNATAHYLHNMLFVLGETLDKAAEAVSVQAELYRANAITNYDTASLRIQVKSGAEIMFYTTHAVSRLRGPEFVYEFENGTVTFCRGRMVGVTGDGEVIEYGNPVQDVSKKLGAAIHAAATGDRSVIVCDATTALMHARCMNGAQESVDGIVEFPAGDVYKMGVPGAQVKVMPGLAENMERAYAEGKMLGEVWQKPFVKIGRVFNLTDYNVYPSC